MRRTVLITLFIGICISLLSQTTWVVKTDGTGDFTIIQEAIVASVSGDTILVHPGRYVENIDFSGKNIYLTSLYKYSNDRLDIVSTIIDGNGSDVVSFGNLETRDAILDGFTIENGFTGIKVDTASPTIRNCIIQKNIGQGGIYVAPNTTIIYSPLLLSGNVIKHNISFGEGGGVSIKENYIFDPIHKNSIFENRASFTHDIYLSPRALECHVVLDTFTVSDNYDNHIFTPIISVVPITFQFENSVMHFVNHDLYVSTVGDDINNNGQSPESPFKTVSHAMYMIASDPVSPKTIHVAPGVYSIDDTGEFFSIIMKSHINLQGAGPELTIFDGENINDDRPFITSTWNTTDFKIKGIGFRNWGQGSKKTSATAIKLVSFSGFEIDNCYFEDGIIGISHLQKLALSYWGYNEDSTAIFKNLVFRNLVKQSLSIYIGNGIFENITITGQRYQYDTETNTIMTNPPIIFLEADEMTHGIYPEQIYTKNHVLSNILIYDNNVYKLHDGSSRRNFDCNVMFIGTSTNVLINNATIVDNLSISTGQLSGGPIELRLNSSLAMYNSLVYNNSPNGTNIFFSHTLWHNHGCSDLLVRNSLFQDGEGSIDIWGSNYMNHDPDLGFIRINWGEGNLESDPLFDNTDLANPYQLCNNSPAIGTGTLDLPNGYILPLTDIVGNPRITNGEIDMGVYQRDSNADFDETIPQVYTALIGNYPNPFNPETTISFQMALEGKVQIDIFNIKGQKIKTIINQYISKGSHKVVWNGVDDTGRGVSSGVYFYQMQTDNCVVAKKMLLMK